MNHWTMIRLVEPSTHTAVAVFLGLTGLYLNSLTLEVHSWTGPLLIWSIAHAFFGVVLKEGKGLFR
jgi:hypothetical protein